MKLLILIAFLCTGTLSCTTATPHASETERSHRFESRFARVTPAGEVVLQDGTTFGLAGIDMRSVEETQEPELLDVVNDIVSRESQSVRIEHHTESDTVTVYYTQGLYHFPIYILPITWVRNFLEPTSTGTVNELLIVMAAAKYDPSVGRMTDAATRRCEDAVRKANLALRTRNRYRRLARYKSRRRGPFGYNRGAGQVYTDQHGYRARITKGDVPQRDANLAGK